MNEKAVTPKRDRDHERLLGIVFGLSPAQAGVLSYLSRGTYATSDQLLEYIGAKSNIKVVVSRTRAKVKEYGVEIKSRIRVGYWIEADEREKVQGVVNDYLKGNGGHHGTVE